MEKNMKYLVGEKFFVNNYEKNGDVYVTPEMKVYFGTEGEITKVDHSDNTVRIFDFWWPFSALTRTRSIAVGTNVKLERFKRIDGLISNSGLEGLIDKVVKTTRCENNLIAFMFEGREYWWPIKNVVVHNFVTYEHKTALKIGDVVRLHDFNDTPGGLRFKDNMKKYIGTTAKISGILENGNPRFENHMYTWDKSACEFIKSTKKVFTKQTFPAKSFVLGLVRNKEFGDNARAIIKSINETGLVVTQEVDTFSGNTFLIRFENLDTWEFPTDIRFNEWKTL